MDQNEILVNYGVTYVIAQDGFSGNIVMPRKNNEVIYETVYRAAICEYGLWHQLRVDHGKEFYLSLYIQEKLRDGRGDPTICPYVQTTSTCNHIIERIWVEPNQRVTYPVKRIVQSMDDCRSINMDCPITKHCVSTVLCHVCEVGMRRMIEAWNNHPIPHRGIPNELQNQMFGTASIQSAEVPPSSDAVALYRDQGGTLCHLVVTLYTMILIYGGKGMKDGLPDVEWMQKEYSHLWYLITAPFLKMLYLDFIEITSDLSTTVYSHVCMN